MSPVTATKKDSKVEQQIDHKESLVLDSFGGSSVGFIPSALSNREEIIAKRQLIQRLKWLSQYLNINLLVFGKFQKIPTNL